MHTWEKVGIAFLIFIFLVFAVRCELGQFLGWSGEMWGCSKAEEIIQEDFGSEIKGLDKIELLKKIKDTVCKRSVNINWRVSLVLAITFSVFAYIYQRVKGDKIVWVNYLVATTVLWFFIYWSRNYIDFHGIKQDCNKVTQMVNQLSNS